jgi:hypothetical protein
MTGYLQRLSLGALNPGGAIHPVLGSVFSAPTFGRTPDVFPGEEDVLSRGRSESYVTPSREAPRVFQDPGPELGPAVSTTVPFQIRSHERTSFKPLVTRTEQEDIERSAVPSVRMKDETGRLEDPEVVHPGPYRPFVAENLRRRDHQETFRVAPSPFSADAGKNEKGNLSRRPGPPEREPDDIQIHIGRIEVTAVPPAPARPAAKPARQSLNLDDYLKRGDGRAR